MNILLYVVSGIVYKSVFLVSEFHVLLSDRH